MDLLWSGAELIVAECSGVVAELVGIWYILLSASFSDSDCEIVIDGAEDIVAITGAGDVVAITGTEDVEVISGAEYFCLLILVCGY